MYCIAKKWAGRRGGGGGGSSWQLHPMTYRVCEKENIN